MSSPPTPAGQAAPQSSLAPSARPTMGPMQRIDLERWQVLLYLLAIGLGLAVGHRWPGVAPQAEAALWPMLALLLYATFVQVPLLHLRDAFGDRRFLGAVLGGNFVLVPLLVWALVRWLPQDPALVLGVALVLLVPCTDWFITFSQLGGGNVPRAAAVTPLNLVLQLLLLPPLLWLVAGARDLPALGLAELGPAVAVVLLPLAVAAVSERWIEARPGRDAWRERLAWAPVPLLAGVVGLIAAGHAGALGAARALLGTAVPVFVAFLLLAAGLAWVLARALRLPPDQGRTLAFSLGTRNSFVVLPFALALPPGWELVAVVVVVQSLVELLGMVLYLWWVPRRLFPPGDPAHGTMQR